MSDGVKAELSFPGRIFQVWRYAIGHSELLLRSHPRKPDTDRRRIDILCKAVWAIHFPRMGHHTSLTIQRLSQKEIEIFPGEHSGDNHLYRLVSEESVSYISAAAVFARFDYGDHTGLGPFYDTPLSGTDLGSL